MVERVGAAVQRDLSFVARHGVAAPVELERAAVDAVGEAPDRGPEEVGVRGVVVEAQHHVAEHPVPVRSPDDREPGPVLDDADLEPLCNEIDHAPQGTDAPAARRTRAAATAAGVKDTIAACYHNVTT